MRRLHIIHLLGYLLIALSLVMLISAIWSLVEGGPDLYALIISALITAGTGALICLITPFRSEITLVESFALVTLAWFIAGAFGALPYYFYGIFGTYLECYFESISGFTTTGATLIEDIEALPRGILVWRSFTQWLGGMGIIVMFVALLPRLGFRGMNLFRAEMPGVFTDRVVPRIAEMAKKLWFIYMGMTATLLVFLLLAGVSFFHAVTHALTTLPTGGFSPLNDSVAGLHNPAAEIIIIFFMLFAGINFALYYQLIQGKFQDFYRNPELRFYLALAFIAVILVSVNIFAYYDLGETLRRGAFQVVSILTTTGYTTADFNAWPAFSRLLLLIFMFLGGSGGSTSGAMKQVRLILLLKFGYREIYRLIHPTAVTKVKLGERPIADEVLRNVLGFVFLYIISFILASLALSGMGLDAETAYSAVAATIGNVGPGLGQVGAEHTYQVVPPLGKAILSFMMVLGRLEIYTVLVFILAEFRRYRP